MKCGKKAGQLSEHTFIDDADFPEEQEKGPVSLRGSKNSEALLVRGRIPHGDRAAAIPGLSARFPDIPGQEVPQFFNMPEPV